MTQRLPRAEAFSGIARLRAAIVVAALGIGLSGCNALQRLSEVGGAPVMSEITNPNQDHKPVTLPMPPPLLAENNPNSLWRPGARAFFKDEKASRVGDLVTVTININDNATLNNQTTRTRTDSGSASLSNFFGLESNITAAGASPTNLVNDASALSNAGAGSVKRSEAVTLQIAALVTEVLPNGNLVLRGSQEVRVNFDLRRIEISGVIRPEDILPTNSIPYTQIAEARISYGGKGQIMDVQQPRYGDQLFDILMPW